MNTYTPSSDRLLSPADALGDVPTLPAGTVPGVASGAGAVLATALAPIAPPAASEAALRSRLFSRVAHSAAVNREFITVRRGDGQWLPVAPGLRVKLLHADGGARAALLEWAPGTQIDVDWTTLPGAARLVEGLNGDATAGSAQPALVHEYLLLQGDLTVAGAALQAHDYQLIGTAAEAVSSASRAGAVAYVRLSAPGRSAFGDVAQSHRVPHGDAGWEPLRRGVMIKPLFAQGGRMSMLARFEPGATVPRHSHAAGEECLMVQGDLFLGDLLLCQGEFQFGPAGSGHADLLSDVGCTLFFHGAVDPDTMDPEVRAAAGY